MSHFPTHGRTLDGACLVQLNTTAVSLDCNSQVQKALFYSTPSHPLLFSTTFPKCFLILGVESDIDLHLITQ